MAPIWKEIATKLKGKVNVAKIDCGKAKCMYYNKDCGFGIILTVSYYFPVTCHEHKVEVTPTIKL
jgi:hypothetical protein